MEIVSIRPSNNYLSFVHDSNYILCVSEANATPSPKTRFGRRGSTFSSVRLSQKVYVSLYFFLFSLILKKIFTFSPSNPIRRNTTRARGRSYKKDKVYVIKNQFNQCTDHNTFLACNRNGSKYTKFSQSHPQCF